MLQNTFIHLPHIGLSTEQRLWENDITDWYALLNEKNEYSKRFQHIKHLLKLSQIKLKTRDIEFFVNRLLNNHHWRIYPEFIHETAYLDIETTGLGNPGDHITTISVYNGKEINYYIHGKNLDRFKNDITKYKVIITYNGKCFDVPFIERELGIHLNQAHLDLRYILRSFGISGGLKSCEHQLGLSRGELEGIDGYFAVLLWKDYRNGNKKALNTLLAYNIEDTMNLEKLMLYSFDRKFKELPISVPSLENFVKNAIKKNEVKVPFKPDFPTIDRLKRKYY